MPLFHAIQLFQNYCGAKIAELIIGDDLLESPFPRHFEMKFYTNKHAQHDDGMTPLEYFPKIKFITIVVISLRNEYRE